MNGATRPDPSAREVEISPELLASAKAVGTWVGHLARTLKTCRLYDATNPTVVKFRLELGSALRQLVEEHGAITLRLGLDDVLYEGVSVQPPRSSREDNLALPFYRDGVRALTIVPGVQQSEVVALLDAVLQVTGQQQGEDDLVTLLWQAELPHIHVEYVPAESDLGEGAEGPGAPEPVMWPTPEEESAEPVATPEGSVHAPTVEAAGTAGRSDDWTVGEHTIEIEATFDELEVLAQGTIPRFQEEFQQEHTMSLSSLALALARAYVGANSTADDRAEMGRFLPRVLRLAVTQGNWKESREAVLLLRSCGSAAGTIESFMQELLQPISVVMIREKLEAQDASGVSEFISFVRETGEASVELFGLVHAELQSPRAQRLLTEAVVELCRDTPERLAPWLSDARSSVVRHAVQALAAIGGNQIVGLLAIAMRHAEPRVRYEAVAALKTVDPKVARPLLKDQLGTDDPRMFCTVLFQLGENRDPATAELLLGFLLDPEFEKRTIEEKRAIYSALAGCGGDEILPEMEVELHKATWFGKSNEMHRQAVARCIARVGTPLARETLERGGQSKRAPVRKACEDALARFGAHD